MVEGLRDFQGMLNCILKNRIEAEFGGEARAEYEIRQKTRRKPAAAKKQPRTSSNSV